jgi:hypothetical protein
MTIKIKSWKRFQHFKDRRPPWIKLHRDVLDDLEWHELDPTAAKTLVMLWLLASEDKDKEGKIPCVKELAFRMRTTESVIESILPKLSHWLEQDGLELISPQHQPDSPETEESTKAVEAEEPPKEAKPKFTPPDTIRPEVWKAFEDHRKKLRKPMTDHARELIVRECEKLGGDPNELLDQSIRKGWQDVFPLKEQTPSHESTVVPIKPTHLCVSPGCEKIGIIGNGRRMYCREHNPDRMGVATNP